MSKIRNNLSHTALMAAAKGAVAGALAVEFPIDPIIGPHLSKVLSAMNSVVKRHGPLIEMGIAAALVASERYVVLPHVSVPLTKTAGQLVAAGNTHEVLTGIRLPHDEDVEGQVNIDLVVVECETGSAMACEIKRGNGVTEHRKRQPTMRKLGAALLVLPSFLEYHGYGPIRTATRHIIDYFGSSGFDPEVTLTRLDLDEHFGVPVVGTVDAITVALQDELHAELPRMFRPFIDSLPDPASGSGLPTRGAAEMSSSRQAAVRSLSLTPAFPRSASRLRVPTPFPSHSSGSTH
jgi:hypothetical protein